MKFDTVAKTFKTVNGRKSAREYAAWIGANPLEFESNLWEYVNSLGYRYHDIPRTVEVDITKLWKT